MSEADRTDPSPDPQPKPKGGVSMTRNVISAILLIAIGAVAIIEISAVVRSQAAVKRLEAAMPDATPDGPGADMVPLTKVNELLGREPDGAGTEEGGLLTKTYTWKGVFRKHQLTTTFSPGNPPALLSFQIGDAEATGGGD
jgi:hypothetical protein